MIYEITHLTRYSYGASVELTTGVLRLAPRSGDGQELQRFSIVTDPIAQPLTERLDPFGNRVASLRIEKPHRRLSIMASHAYASIEPLRRREVLLGRLLPRRRSRYPHLNWTAPQLRSIHHVELRFLKKRPLTQKRASRQGVRFLMRRASWRDAFIPTSSMIQRPLKSALRRKRRSIVDEAFARISPTS